MKTLILIALLAAACDAFGQESGIIFQEDFEASSITEMISKWDEAKNPANMSFSGDVPPGSPGSQSVVMTYTQGQNSGGHLYKMRSSFCTYGGLLPADHMAPGWCRNPTNRE
jgi:hypothetical protein